MDNLKDTERTELHFSKELVRATDEAVFLDQHRIGYNEIQRVEISSRYYGFLQRPAKYVDIFTVKRCFRVYLLRAIFLGVDSKKFHDKVKYFTSFASTISRNAKNYDVKITYSIFYKYKYMFVYFYYLLIFVLVFCVACLIILLFIMPGNALKGSPLLLPGFMAIYQVKSFIDRTLLPPRNLTPDGGQNYIAEFCSRD